MTPSINKTGVPDINPETGTRFDFTFFPDPSESTAIRNIPEEEFHNLLINKSEMTARFWHELIRIGREDLIIQTAKTAGLIMKVASLNGSGGALYEFIEYYAVAALYGVGSEQYLETAKYALTLFSLGLEDKQIEHELSPKSEYWVNEAMSIIGQAVTNHARIYNAPNN